MPSKNEFRTGPGRPANQPWRRTLLLTGHILLLVATLGLTALYEPAAAQSTRTQKTVPQARPLPIGAVLQKVLPQIPGQLVRAAQERNRSGALVYKLHILQDSGHILIVTADAYTGAVLNVGNGS